jgi:hypothetical protein
LARPLADAARLCQSRSPLLMTLALVKTARLCQSRSSLLKPLAIAKAALAEKCGSISARLCFFGREKIERELLLFST